MNKDICMYTYKYACMYNIKLLLIKSARQTGFFFFAKKMLMKDWWDGFLIYAGCVVFDQPVQRFGMRQQLFNRPLP